MILKISLALITISLFGNQLLAQSAPQVGDIIALNLEGPLATKYATFTVPTIARPASAPRISTLGTITRKLSDDRLEVERSSLIRNPEKPVRLVTLTAIVPASKILAETKPKGTLVYASPNSQGVPATEETTTRSVKLADFKDLKLRSWKLEEEVGDQN